MLQVGGSRAVMDGSSKVLVPSKISTGRHRLRESARRVAPQGASGICGLGGRVWLGKLWRIKGGPQAQARPPIGARHARQLQGLTSLVGNLV